MTNQKNVAIYYRIPQGMSISESKMVSDINDIKQYFRQSNWNPVHTFIDRGNTATMFITMIDCIKDPVKNISAFICFTAGDSFTDINNSIPVSDINATEQKKFIGGVPYGYKVINGALAIDADKANIVTEIFKLKSEGCSLQTIADALNHRGVKSARDGDWTRQSIHFLLKNQAYTGIYDNNGTITKIPEIISRSLFNKCQRA